MEVRFQKVAEFRLKFRTVRVRSLSQVPEGSGAGFGKVPAEGLGPVAKGSGAEFHSARVFRLPYKAFRK